MSTRRARPTSWLPARSGSGVPAYQQAGPMRSVRCQSPRARVGEPSALRPARVDRIRRLAVAVEADDRAVGEADADEPRGALGPVHPGGKVAALGLAGEHGRQQHGGVAERHRLRCEVQVDVGGRARRRDAVPDALRPVRVVVAGDEVPGHARECPHALERLAQGLRRRRLAVVDVAGDEDVRGPLRQRQPADRLDRIEPRPLQHRLAVAELPERLADLPVGGMDEAHGGRGSVSSGSGVGPASSGVATRTGLDRRAVFRSRRAVGAGCNGATFARLRTIRTSV